MTRPTSQRDMDSKHSPSHFWKQSTSVNIEDRLNTGGYLDPVQREVAVMICTAILTYHASIEAFLASINAQGMNITVFITCSR
jgi:hypothetical protein